MELLGIISILPSLVHVHYVLEGITLSSLLCQWVEQVYIRQIQGNSTVMENSGQVRMGPLVIPEKHSLRLSPKNFTRHTIHIRPNNQTLVYANFKVKTIKNFLGKNVQIPPRVKEALHEFTLTPISQTGASTSVFSERMGLTVLCLNVQISVQPKVRALQVLIKQAEYPAAILLHEVGKTTGSFIFHPFYAAYDVSPAKNSIGACILVRRTQHIIVTESHFEPNHRAVIVRALICHTKAQIVNVYLKSGGEPHIAQAMAKFRAGIAQGCPMSALLFCILLELRIRMVLHNIPVSCSTCGNFAHVAYMDDTTYLLDTLLDVQHLLQNLYQTGIRTHLHTSTIKLLVVVAHRQGTQTIFHRLDVMVGGNRAPTADGNAYILLLGRHAMPHVFHTNDFIKMMKASRRASVVLRYIRLPANYPILMYNASARGVHIWLGSIRPSAPGTMRLADHPAASTLRARQTGKTPRQPCSYNRWRQDGPEYSQPQ